MTDHASEAAEKIDETIRKSTLDYDYLVQVIQAAIDAACAEKDAKIAAQKIALQDCRRLLAGEVVPLRRTSLGDP